jgi:hypothetical protein
VVTVDDIATVVLTRLAAVAGHATTCPGLHWFARGPDEPAGYPYDVFQVEAGPARYTLGDFYTQTFTVRWSAYCPAGEVGVSAQNAEKLFADALLTDAANIALRAVALRNANENVLEGRQSTAKGEFAPALREARDVFLAGVTADLIVLGRTDLT